MAVLKLTGLDSMTRKTTKVKQAKTYPAASVLYCTYANLPDSLSSNALIFTTDTAELYVGTGTGIQKLKLGSEEDLDPRIYLKIAEAKDIYQTKLQAEAVANEIMGLLSQLNEGVYSKEEIDKFITEDVDLDGVIDKLNTYTVDKINEILETKAQSTDVYTREQTNEKLNTLKTNLEALISGLSDTLDSVKQELEAADSKDRAELETLVNDTKEVLIAADASDKAELEDLVSETKTVLAADIAAVDSRVDEAVASHEQDVQKLQEAIDTNTSGIQTNNSAIQLLSNVTNAKIGLVETNVATLQTNLEEQINANKEDIEAKLTTVNEDLKDSVSTTNNDLATLKDNVYTKAEVDELVNTAISDVLEAIINKLSS